ncbi:hypothetical protein [Halomonas sp. SL1]|uniref:hypothetical protein n=1 Tax=Halomonas sp. SL1 TaxID=2137478 RepID=UPI000D4F8E93|nr:hypothetical protein [Halomonas sp. SL1]
MTRWIGLALLALVLPVEAQVYKCEVGGSTVYQGHPCEGENAGEVQLSEVSGYGSGGGVSLGDPQFKPPEDGASTMQKFRTLMSTLDVIKLKAADCDWALRVRRDISDCQAFAETQSSQYPDALDYMSAHFEEFAGAIDPGRLNQMTRTLNEINDIQRFSLEYFKSMNR